VMKVDGLTEGGLMQSCAGNTGTIKGISRCLPIRRVACENQVNNTA